MNRKLKSYFLTQIRPTMNISHKKQDAITWQKRDSCKQPYDKEAAIFRYSFHTHNSNPLYRGLLKHRTHVTYRLMWIDIRKIVIFLYNKISVL